VVVVVVAVVVAVVDLNLLMREHQSHSSNPSLLPFFFLFLLLPLPPSSSPPPSDYPEEMKKHVGPRLPRFTEEEKADLKGSSDFFAINHYSTNYVGAPTDPNAEGGSW